MLSDLWSAYVHYTSIVAHNPVFIYGTGFDTGACAMYAYLLYKKTPAPNKK